MELKSINLTELQSTFIANESELPAQSLSGVIETHHRGDYVNDRKLFIAHFNSIPNVVHELQTENSKAIEWFTKKYRSEIKTLYYNEWRVSSKHAGIDSVCYLLFEDLIVSFDNDNFSIRFLYRKTNYQLVEDVIANIRIFKKRRHFQSPEILLIVQSRSGLSIKALPIKKPKLSIEDNYNDDFQEIHQTILKRLMTKNDKGMVLLMVNLVPAKQIISVT